MYYEYDATTERDEYEKMTKENQITNRIVDLGMIDNYSDFGIIYANNASVGWISNDTKIHFGVDDNMYELVSSYIVNEKSEDGWFCGVDEDYTHLYYVKRVNEHAVLLISIYTRELDRIYHYTDELKDMTIRLVDEKNRVIYSSNHKEIGRQLQKEIADYAKKSDRVSAISRNYLITANRCDNDWKVVCSVSAKRLFSKINATRNHLIMLAVAAIVFLFAALIFLLQKMTHPMGGYVSRLEERASIDGLSGVFNKSMFCELVKASMSEKVSNKISVFLMLDVDNFKSINDHLGHNYGDQVIKRMGELLKRQLNNEEICGRVGGDEFALLIWLPANETARQLLDGRLTQLLRAFAQEFQVEHREYHVSLSVGAVKVLDGDTYLDVSERADQLLYQAKSAGKNQYRIGDM